MSSASATAGFSCLVCVAGVVDVALFVLAILFPACTLASKPCPGFEDWTTLEAFIPLIIIGVLNVMLFCCGCCCGCCVAVAQTSGEKQADKQPPV